MDSGVLIRAQVLEGSLRLGSILALRARSGYRPDDRGIVDLVGTGVHELKRRWLPKRSDFRSQLVVKLKAL